MERCTFAIVSHPDAGKTTMTEKLLLFGGAIQMAGTVKGRKASRHATSDWMELEKQRGISVTTSVMQFPYGNRLFNLLDTPGHADFSEDTYRTLTAVDSALMVIDAAKGVEARTLQLMEICRLRKTPIISFVNKMDRDAAEPISLLDEMESALHMKTSPITWPIGMGRSFRGVYHIPTETIRLYESTLKGDKTQIATVLKWGDPALETYLGEELLQQLQFDKALIQEASNPWSLEDFRAGHLTPVFFGSALNNFGVQELLEGFVEYAPGPQKRASDTRWVEPEETACTGFVFKIQANMDLQHRDRVAFVRLCSGTFRRGMKWFQVRLKREAPTHGALVFMAGDRHLLEEAAAGDIIGIHNHGSIQIGDTFTEGESLNFLGVPYFAPELFKSVRAKDPLKAKALQKGLVELSEEGATQVFRPLQDNRILLGAVGVLQFDVVAHRLKHEYKVDCIYEPTSITTIRWVSAEDPKIWSEFEKRHRDQLALDGAEAWVYLASSRANLSLMEERWGGIAFSRTREVQLG